MRPRTIILITFLSTLTLLAGCIATPPGAQDTASAGASSNGDVPQSSSISEAYADAPTRAYNEVGGAHQEEVTINVPLFTEKLVVGAAYSVGGAGQFSLSMPGYVPQKTDRFAGARDTWDDEWFVIENPVPGPWTFHVQLAGGGEYAFGFYY